MTEEELLIEAKRRYPIGAKFISPEDGNRYDITDQGFYDAKVTHSGPIVILAVQKSGNGEYVYYNNKWAEILSLPKPKLTKDQK